MYSRRPACAYLAASPTLRLLAASILCAGALTACAARNDTALINPSEPEYKKFDQPGEAAKFFTDQRMPPGANELPLEDLLAASEQIKARKAQLASLRGSQLHPGDIATWEHLGPGNIGGRTRALVIDPSNPFTMYAAGVNGGVWKSTNSGADWTALDDLLPNLAVSALAIDPTNPNILYAGTGEGTFPRESSPRGVGIFKTTDAGATWNLLPSTSSPSIPGAFHYVNKIVISANDAGRIYAATRTGVWRSENAGDTWTLILANPTYASAANETGGCIVGCIDLVARTDRNPDTLFAAFGSFEHDGLFRSTDGGDTWTEYDMGDMQGRMDIAIAPSNQDVAYICMAGGFKSVGGVGKLVDVYRTTDGGDTWEPRVDFMQQFSPWLLSHLQAATGCFGFQTYHQGWHDIVIKVDPLNHDQVWVGGIDLFRSDDGGQTWGLANYGFASQSLSIPNERYVHVDQHVIAFHPDYDGFFNQIMYVGNDGGLFCTPNARANVSLEECPNTVNSGDPPTINWINLNNGYAVTQFYHGDAASDQDIFIGGAQDNGTSKADSADEPDQWAPIFGGDGGYVAIDPTNSAVVYIEIQGFPEIRKSVNGGVSFFKSVDGIFDPDGLFISPFAMDQQSPNILWTGGTRPWRTTNGASSWSAAGPSFLVGDLISAIAIAPSNSNVVYVGSSSGDIARTDNALDVSPSWQNLSAGLPNGAWVSSIAVDPVNPLTVYCTYSNFGVPHVFRSTNGGGTWQSIDGAGATGLPDIPAHWIEVRPTNSSQLYLATELGVFTSDDAGATWNIAGDNFPSTVVESLDFKDADTLVAFTHGRGAFLARLNSCPADFSGDGAVGAVDLSILIGFWNEDAPDVDLSGDGVISAIDIATLLGLWGPCQ